MTPLAVDLRGRRVVVVGGGPAAARVAADRVADGADVLVVAPALCEDLAELIGDGRAAWRPRDYEPGDLDGAWLVHPASGGAGRAGPGGLAGFDTLDALDTRVAADAEAARTWCVPAAAVPAVVRRDGVVVAVTTEDGDAGAAPDDGAAPAVVGGIARALDEGRIPLRRSTSGAAPGRVDLVGGGPGDPDLLTLRGRRLLAQADVVVVDRLAPRAVLDELDDDVLVVDVGKAPDAHPVPQAEIERLLVEHARAGARVVRLKGGDPFVLGRGGEEVAACRAAGVPVAVVPGVTSAVAVPAAAGIPVTHRGTSRAVTVVTGHDVEDWSRFAPPLVAGQATLVVLMGVSRLPEVAGGLVAAGVDPATPVAVVERGCTPAQRTTRARLRDVVALAGERGVRAPAVVVVGDVAALELGGAPPTGADWRA